MPRVLEQFTNRDGYERKASPPVDRADRGMNGQAVPARGVQGCGAGI